MRWLCFLLLGCGPRVVFDGMEAGGSDAPASETSTCSNPSPYWPDLDGDGFGDALSAPTMACTKPAKFAGNNKDCGDGDAKMRPDQLMANVGPAKGQTSGSPFDYNCDGKEEVKNVVLGDCSLNGANMCIYTAGFGTVPTSCQTQIGWVNRCGTTMVSACSAKLEEMRFPDCL